MEPGDYYLCHITHLTFILVVSVETFLPAGFPATCCADVVQSAVHYSAITWDITLQIPAPVGARLPCLHPILLVPAWRPPVGCYIRTRLAHLILLPNTLPGHSWVPGHYGNCLPFDATPH